MGNGGRLTAFVYKFPVDRMLWWRRDFSATADTGPQPPCGDETFPEYPDLGSSPVVKVWNRSVLGHDWVPPACTGWTTPGFSALVVTIARFQHSGDGASLLHRIAAISELAGMRYWSTTHKRSQTLIPSARAVSS